MQKPLRPLNCMTNVQNDSNQIQIAKEMLDEAQPITENRHAL